MQIDHFILGRITTQPTDSLTQSLAFGIEERLFSIYGCSFPLSCCRIVSSGDCSVRDNPVVPESNASGLPLPTDGEIISRMEMVA